MTGGTYVVGVVLPQDPATALVDALVAAVAAAHAQRRVHVHVVTRKVQGDEALEHNTPAGEGLGQEDQQAGCCAAIRHHVQHSAKLGALLKLPGGVSVECVEET